MKTAAITGQTTPIPLFTSQQNSVPSDSGTVSTSMLQEWQAGLDHPGEIVCTGPKYQYPYSPRDSTHVHLSTQGYERLGEKYAEVYFERIVRGDDWQPLQPIAESVAGSVVTVQFHVPSPPLTWDDNLPAPHGATIPEWANGRGFEVLAANVRQTITDVEIMGTDTVQITCQSDLTGARSPSRSPAPARSDLYVIRAKEMKQYLDVEYGRGTLIYDATRNPKEIVNLQRQTQGVIVFDWEGRPRDLSAGGHVDLFRLWPSGDSLPRLEPACFGECFWWTIGGPMKAYLRETLP